MTLDNEVATLRAAYAALSSMPPEARPRAVAWLTARLDHDQRAGLAAALVIARVARRLGRMKPALAA